MQGDVGYTTTLFHHHFCGTVSARCCLGGRAEGGMALFRSFLPGGFALSELWCLYPPSLPLPHAGGRAGQRLFHVPWRTACFFFVFATPFWFLLTGPSVYQHYSTTLFSSAIPSHYLPFRPALPLGLLRFGCVRSSPFAGSAACAWLTGRTL